MAPVRKVANRSPKKTVVIKKKRSKKVTDKKDREELEREAALTEPKALRDPTVGPAPVVPHIPAVPRPTLPNPDPPPQNKILEANRARRTQLLADAAKIREEWGGKEMDIPVNSAYWTIMNEMRSLRVS